MNSFVKFCLFLAIGACVVYALNAELSDNDVAKYVDAFNQYQIKFNKHYDTKEEYNKRLRAYAISMERIKKLNARDDDTATYGETSLSDITDEEFDMMNQAVRIPVGKGKKIGREINTNSFPKPKLAVDHEYRNMPESYNWFDIPEVKHPAKNQGSCGSCWAFAGAGAIEMQGVLEGLDFHNVSREQLVDCSGGMVSEGGCCGGFPGDAYERIGFYLSEEEYPYVLSDWKQGSSCTPNSCHSYTEEQAVYKIRGYDSFLAMSPSELKKQIWVYGPISVYLEAVRELTQYNGGIFDCTGKTVSGGHYVVAVGYGPNYIILRNSWGSNWGMEGDFYLSDKSTEASCKMISDTGTSQYLQMARVSVESAYRVVPIIAILMVFFLLL